MNFHRTLAAAAALAVAVLSTPLRAADPWADAVVSYTPGSGIGNDFVTGNPFDDPLVALGEPTRITSLDSFPSAVTPLNGPFRSTEVVSLGAGGQLVVRFDEPVANDPGNPYGIDLLVFGNAFFVGNFGFPLNPAGTASGVQGEGGLIEVSADNMTYFPVAGAADGLFPTNAYTDVPDAYGGTPGTSPADFTRPVDPGFDPLGKTFSQIIAGYNGSGGGLGVDIGPTGLASISYVRITNPAGAAATPEIDAFADVASVPEPGGSLMFFFGALIFLGKTAPAVNVKEASGGTRGSA